MWSRILDERAWWCEPVNGSGAVRAILDIISEADILKGLAAAGFGPISATTIYERAASAPRPTLQVFDFSAEPRLSDGGILNAASFAANPVSPGEIVTIFGKNMGPAALAGVSLTAGGLVATTAGGTQVF